MTPNNLPYVESVHSALVGGGEEATFIVLKGGRTIVLAFGIVGVYESEESYWEGETEPIWMSEEDLCEL